MLPPRKPAGLTVVAVVGEEELGADEENAAIQAENTAVVPHALEHDGHSEIAQEVIGAS